MPPPLTGAGGFGPPGDWGNCAAAEVVDRLKGCGLCRDRASAPPAGDNVFVYRKTPSALPPPAHDHPPFRKFA
jgi:hypothetical protein